MEYGKEAHYYEEDALDQHCKSRPEIRRQKTYEEPILPPIKFSPPRA